MTNINKLSEEDFKNWEMIFNREQINPIDKFNMAVLDQNMYKIKVKFVKHRPMPIVYWVNHKVTPIIFRLINLELNHKMSLFTDGWGKYDFNLTNTGSNDEPIFKYDRTSFTPFVDVMPMIDVDMDKKTVQTPTLFSERKSLCSNFLRELGEPYGRTCALCGIGPCTAIIATTEVQRISAEQIEQVWCEVGSAAEWAEYRQTLLYVVNKCIKIASSNNQQ